MKKEINLKDTVWIHLGESSLVAGRVVEIIDLAHLDEGHDPDREFYIIEIKTGIDDVYEVRDYGQISLTPKGPINAFKNISETTQARRFLKKVGMKLPEYRDDDDDELTPEEITAAIERSQQATKHQALNLQRESKPKKRYYRKKKQAT
jgi:hypothetical protein